MGVRLALASNSLAGGMDGVFCVCLSAYLYYYIIIS